MCLVIYFCEILAYMPHDNTLVNTHTICLAVSAFLDAGDMVQKIVVWVCQRIEEVCL